MVCLLQTPLLYPSSGKHSSRQVSQPPPDFPYCCPYSTVNFCCLRSSSPTVCWRCLTVNSHHPPIASCPSAPSPPAGICPDSGSAGRLLCPDSLARSFHSSCSPMLELQMFLVKKNKYTIGYCQWNQFKKKTIEVADFNSLGLEFILIVYIKQPWKLAFIFLTLSGI